MGRSKKEEIELCSHVKTNGACCDSPALHDQHYCFFHASIRERTKRMRRAARHNLPLHFPVLEDQETIQLATGDTLNALLAGQIDHKTAALLLRGLQTASRNVEHLNFETFESDRVYEHYHNQEEEQMEREIAEEIEQEQKAADTSADANTVEPVPHDVPQPLRKAPKSATQAELVNVACKLAMIQAREIAAKAKQMG
jgi:hypothetical protein